MTPTCPRNNPIRSALSWRSQLGCLLATLFIGAMTMNDAAGQPAAAAVPTGVGDNPPSASSTTTPGTAAQQMTFEEFLDRLMLAESSGRDDARNPLSTALGPFQFIEATWLQVMRRHFAEETSSLDTAQLLSKRTDRALARRAAEAYSKDNAAILQEAGLEASFPNLRLAFLLGAGGAVRVLKSPPEAQLASILGAAVIRSNPFMRNMNVGALVARAARDLRLGPAEHPGLAAADIPAGSTRRYSTVSKQRSQVKVACNLQRASCKRWLALATARLTSPPRNAHQQRAAAR